MPHNAHSSDVLEVSPTLGCGRVVHLPRRAVLASASVMVDCSIVRSWLVFPPLGGRPCPFSTRPYPRSPFSSRIRSSMRRRWQVRRSSPAIAAERSMSTTMTFAPSSSGRQDHAALAVLLGLNGLRVSEACGTNVEDLAYARGHRTLRIRGNGNKPATDRTRPDPTRGVAARLPS